MSQIPETEFDETVKLHYNKPQLLVHLIMAQIIVCVWGRRTGKTEGPMADFTLNNIHAMPRSNGFLVGTTYEQLLTRTLPPLVAAWEKRGYYQDVHYWIRKFPPPELKVPKAYRCPLKADHYITWYNGSGIYLVSQDRPGTINGVSTQWGAGDEAKFLNYQKLREEALLTLSGNAEYFGELSCYLSLMFCSDMPTTSKGMWLLDYKEQMDEQAVNLILAVQRLRQEAEMKLEQVTSKKKRAALQQQLATFDMYLNELRKDLVYYCEATTLDNIHALGLAPIKQFKRTLNDTVFNTSVLNKKVLKAVNGFYSTLDDDVHAYDAINYEFLDHLELDYTNPAKADCRWDKDVNTNAPIDVALDYNNAINSLTAGQGGGRKYRGINSMFVLKTEGQFLPDLIKKFCTYYKHHRNKTVNYYYDHTAIGGNAMSNISYADEVIAAFREEGWHVNEIYIGQAASHHSRYLLWEMLLAGDSRLDEFSYNRTRFAAAALSMQQAGVKKVGDTFQKDKSSEAANSGVKPEEATHLSDAADTLIWGTQRHKIKSANEGDFVDTQWME